MDLSNPPLQQNTICEVESTLSYSNHKVKGLCLNVGIHDQILTYYIYVCYCGINNTNH